MTVGFNNGGGERSWRQTATGSVLRSGGVAARITVQPGGSLAMGTHRQPPLGWFPTVSMTRGAPLCTHGDVHRATARLLESSSALANNPEMERIRPPPPHELIRYLIKLQVKKKIK